MCQSYVLCCLAAAASSGGDHRKVGQCGVAVLVSVASYLLRRRSAALTGIGGFHIYRHGACRQRGSASGTVLACSTLPPVCHPADTVRQPQQTRHHDVRLTMIRRSSQAPALASAARSHIRGLTAQAAGNQAQQQRRKGPHVGRQR